jgi:RNA polymerase sigma factor (sigma-70 family)
VFRPLGESELLRLDDDQLIAYLRTARRAGDPSDRLALGILVRGHWDNIRRRVSLRVPREAVEDVAGDVVMSAIQSAFDGSSQGEFGAWLGQIIRRRIADYHRRRESQAATLDDLPLIAPDEHEIETRDAIERVLARRNPRHRAVLERWLSGVPAAEIAELEGLSATNVHQIISRFRADLRRELDTG